jgi:5-methyltetrahydrofolate--homocysteine methyltransferase
MEELKGLAEKVEKGRHLEVADEVRKALDKGIPPYTILLNGLQAGLAVIGERFKKDECFIPEVLLAARAMHTGINLLRPLLAKAGNEPIATVVLGTVKDDLHDIGKNMVGMMLEGSGFRVIDVGINVPPERFAETVQKEGATILALSALLSTTMPYLKTTIEMLKEKGIRDSVKVLVGGAPVTEEYAMSVGADGYAPDAARAVDKAKELLKVAAF